DRGRCLVMFLKADCPRNIRGTESVKYLKFAVCFAFALIFAGTAAQAQEEKKDLSFYEVSAADLAGKPGTLIRYEPLHIFEVYRAQAYRILYRTSDMHGRPSASSGVAVVSDYGPAKKAIVARAPPTTGVTR